MSSFRSDKAQELTVKLDYEQLLFEALRKVNTAFDSPEFLMREAHTKTGGSTTSASHIGIDRYEYYVLNVLAHILPKWIEEDNDKYPERFARWATKVTQFELVYAEWKVLHKDWENGTRDPLKEPIEPVNPAWNAFGEVAPPKPFSLEVRDCKVNGQWKPINLYHVILKFLHRKGFFKRWEIETIEAGEAEALDNDETPKLGSPETTRPVGGPTGPINATA